MTFFSRFKPQRKQKPDMDLMGMDFERKAGGSTEDSHHESEYEGSTATPSFSRRYDNTPGA